MCVYIYIYIQTCAHISMFICVLAVFLNLSIRDAGAVATPSPASDSSQRSLITEIWLRGCRLKIREYLGCRDLALMRGIQAQTTSGENLARTPWLGHCVIRLMDKILHDPKDPKLWELWYIPYNG